MRHTRTSDSTARLFLALFTAALTACAARTAQSTAPTPHRLAAACMAPRYRSPLATNSEARGLASFHRVCGNCHPGGDADVGPRLLGAHFAESHVREQIRRGGGDMSAIPETCISRSDVDDVIAYLRDLEAVR